MKNIRQGDIVLPDRAAAIDTINRFTELDPRAVTDHTRLAHALGGMSAALSAVALDYGKTHRPPGIESNIGLWTEVDNGADRHKFTVTPQDIFGLNGAAIWRSAIEGGTDRYYRHVEVPAEKILREMQDADPTTLQQGWTAGRPHWEDIYAVAVTTDQGVRTHRQHWPFHLPASRSDSYPTTPTEDAIGYSRLLQDLSKTLLEVVR